MNCNANEKAISAGTGWSDDAADRELWTQRMTPLLTGTNVTGFRATGGNDSGNTQHVHALRPLLYGLSPALSTVGP